MPRRDADRTAGLQLQFLPPEPPQAPRQTTTTPAKATPKRPATKQQTAPAAPEPGQRIRTKQPGPVKFPLTVRLRRLTDARFTLACRKTGLGPSGALEAAIMAYCDANGIPADLPVRQPGEPSGRTKTDTPSEPGDTYGDLVPVTVKISPLADARLTHAWNAFVTSVQDLTETMLNAYFYRLGVPSDPARDEDLAAAYEVSKQRAEAYVESQQRRTTRRRKG